MPDLLFGGLRVIITLFFGVLTLCLFIQALLSWFPIPPNHPVPRFFRTINAPLLEPVTRWLPPVSAGPLDLRVTVAFIFVWFVLGTLLGLFLQAIPVTTP